MVNFSAPKSTQLLDSMLDVTGEMINSQDLSTIAGGVSGMLQNAAVWIPPLTSEQGYSTFQIATIFASLNAALSFSLSTAEGSLAFALQWVGNLEDALSVNLGS